jgi:hypothetical protein
MVRGESGKCVEWCQVLMLCSATLPRLHTTRPNNNKHPIQPLSPSQRPHTPLDTNPLQVTVVEATDDSYLFATTQTTLAKFCLEIEQFQYAYGWLTQWTKMKAYIMNPPGVVAETIKMPSVTTQEGINPWVISYHDVPLYMGELEFLRAKVNLWEWAIALHGRDTCPFWQLTMR